MGAEEPAQSRDLTNSFFSRELYGSISSFFVKVLIVLWLF